MLRVHRCGTPVDDVGIEGVLDVGAAAGGAEDALGVGLVLGEEELGTPLAVQPARPQFAVPGRDDRDPPARLAPLQAGSGRLVAFAPAPRVPEQERREDVDLGRLASTVRDGHPDQDVLRRRLRVLGLHVEVAVALEHARVDELVLELLPRPRPVDVDQVEVRKRRLRVLVEPLHVRVGRRGVEVVIQLLDVLSVVAFGVGEPEQALLQDLVPAVPEREGEAQPLVVVGETRQPILSPAVGARARLVVREIVPGIAVRAVVLTHRPPLPFGEVRSPPSPWNAGPVRLQQPCVLDRPARIDHRPPPRLTDEPPLRSAAGN